MFKMIPMLVLISLTSMSACSFKSQSGGNDPTNSDTRGEFSAPGPMTLDPSGDANGDLVTNAKEYEQGRNPLLADLPALHVAFLQNYKISVKDLAHNFHHHGHGLFQIY